MDGRHSRAMASKADAKPSSPKKPEMSEKARKAFEESFARNRKALQKLAKL